MKNIFFLIVFAVLFNQSFAQDSCSHKCKELKHGIQFQVTNIFNITNFDGYTFSYRYLFNKNSGLRIGLLANFANQDNDITQQVDSIISKPPTYHKNFYFKVSVQFLQSILSYNDFDLIIGGGPFVSFFNDEEYSEYTSSSYKYNYTLKTKTTGFGLDLIAGVEYKLVHNVILSGEYGITFVKETSDREYQRNEESQTINHTISQNGEVDRTIISGSNVNLGIAIFF